MAKEANTLLERHQKGLSREVNLQKQCNKGVDILSTLGPHFEKMLPSVMGATQNDGDICAAT